MPLFSCLPYAYRCDFESYLKVAFLDGHVEHLPGPRQLYFNGFKHEKITVEKFRRYVASDSQCVDIVFRDGRFERVLGPCERTFDPFTHEHMHVNTLRRHVASQGEYLVVQYKDGRMEHLRGPQEVCFHPSEHESIELHEAIKLAANEALVVYRRACPSSEELVAKLEVMPKAKRGSGATTKKAKMEMNGTSPPAPANGIEPVADVAAPMISVGVAQPMAAAAAGAAPLLTTEAAGQEGAMHVERRVVHGPAVFIPDSNEWLHTFSWHGSLKSDGKGSKTGYAGDVKVPHALKFTVLRCMPDSMYLSVRDVRTVDDANLTVHLMLFYEITSIETMLDSTNDMIGDFVNAASADVMTFASRLTYETFLQETAELSKKEAFPILASRMQNTGTQLLKVVYRGYGAAAALQEMHDQAISRRTKLRLEADAARDEQEKRSMELRCRRDRSVQEQELESAASRHKLEMLALQKEQERNEADERHARELRYEQARSQMELASVRARHEEQLRCDKDTLELRAAQLAAESAQELQKYEAMKALGVDLTQLLVAQAAATPDQHIRLEHGGAPNPPTVHLEIPRGSAASSR